ncbi:hypothetical protein PRUPE_2G327000 [Prunus persica]|uniref:Malectin-like domain-containing protein n=2 Tax=Prunus persica TaxID=3760 RepID=A0A251QQA2_PRUPE|nr:uncharacterized protein At1g24485 [Prunus persica]ONI25923.1 hypothetical protein PRUPE_2G327000 [Prunus persica]
MNMNILGSIVILLLWVCADAAVFLSIDCGASDSYTDSLSINWVGDDDYVHSGESHLVELSSSTPHVASTLRVFTSLRKNCYAINSVNMIGQRLLVRASFYYGNYDGNNSPPTFDLYFDSTYWTQVNLTGVSDTIVNYEVIYTVNKNNTSICLAQTLPRQFPFISALEFRSLAPKMYTRVASDYALFRQKRLALGAQQLIRYPDDSYDRRWVPGYGLFAYQVEGEARISKMDVSGAEDNPPAAVVQNATTGNNTSEYFELYTYLPDFPVQVYIATFFSEVDPAALTSPNKRSFEIYVDEQPYSKPIVPPFESVVEVAITNITASSKTSITLRPTADSTLPFLINAFEVYLLSKVGPATDTRDVEGLGVLQVQFEVLIIWSGDPCLPLSSSWEWVQCSTGNIPRIIALNLSSFDLVGPLPDFSSMDALVTIDLHDNSLNGPIPDFLGSFPNLKRLDLSNNRFNGTIPTSLSKNKKLELVVTGNCLSGMSCPPPPPPKTPPPPPTTTSTETTETTPPPPPPYNNQRTPPPPADVSQFGSGSTDDSKNNALLSILVAATIQALLLITYFP